MPMTAALILAVVTSLSSGQGLDFEPAGEEAYTLDLEMEGFVNGNMDPRRLMTVAGCTLERDAAYTYSLMLEAADRDGVRLRHEDCYRSYRQQDNAYNRRCPWQEVPVYGESSTGERVQVGSQRMRVCTGPPIAPAGRSNHGWGRAVDFRNARGVLTCYSAEFHWLENNASRFGWVHPPWAGCGKATAEPWHWEFAGVTAPTVLRLVEPVADPLDTVR